LDAPPNAVILGLDLGQVSDYSALAVLEVQTTVGADAPVYAIRALDRWRPRRYQQVVERVAEIVSRLTVAVPVSTPGGGLALVAPAVSLVVDRTGVGRAVGDMFSEARLPVDLVLVSIHGGATISRDSDGGWATPKRDLAGVVAVALQNNRLVIADRLEHAATLKAELTNFRAKIGANGHTRYEAGGDDWRQGNHDDLLLATSMAIWFGEQKRAPGREMYSYSYLDDSPSDDDLGRGEWLARYAR